MMNPLCLINQAYAIVISDEEQKSVSATTKILGSNPASIGYESAIFSKGVGPLVYKKTRGQQVQKFKKNGNLQCEVCKIRGHTKKLLESDWISRRIQVQENI